MLPCAIDPVMTTTQVAERIGMTPQFVREEIKLGRLVAQRHEANGRPTNRITPQNFLQYFAQYWRATRRAL
jgi:hypothetical protein